MRGIGRAHALHRVCIDDPSAIAAVVLSGPRGGYIGDVVLNRAGAEHLRSQLDTILRADTVQRLSAQAARAAQGDELLARRDAGMRASGEQRWR